MMAGFFKKKKNTAGDSYLIFDYLFSWLPMVDDAAFCYPGEEAWERPTAAMRSPTDEVAGELGRLRLDRGKAQAWILEGCRRGRGS